MLVAMCKPYWRSDSMIDKFSSNVSHPLFAATSFLFVWQFIHNWRSRITSQNLSLAIVPLTDTLYKTITRKCTEVSQLHVPRPRWTNFRQEKSSKTILSRYTRAFFLATPTGLHRSTTCMSSSVYCFRELSMNMCFLSTYCTGLEKTSTAARAPKW